MPTISIRVPEEIRRKYLKHEKRMKIYRALQSLAVAMVEGKVDPEKLFGGVECFEARPSKIKEAQRVYSLVIDALLVLQRNDLADLVRNLRKYLAAVALHVPDPGVETRLRGIQAAYRELIDKLIKGEGDVEEAKRRLGEGLWDLKRYLEDKYPVF